MIDAAIEQLDPEVAAQVEEAKAKGKAVMVINEGSDADVIEVDESVVDFDPQKAVFSARITAHKPA
jgi:DNA-binding protein YbaB